MQYRNATRAGAIFRGLPTMAGSARLLTAAVLATALSACKIVVHVPVGGKVVSDDGLECLAGNTCTVDVGDDSFSDAFHAVADEGYVFDHWRQASGYLCGNSATACVLSTAGFAANPSLALLLASDAEFYLEPVFTEVDDRYDSAAWAQLLSELNTSTFRSNAFLYQVTPDTSNCDPGVLSNAATERFHRTVNMIRKLHYLPPVDYDSFYDTQMQEASLIQAANYYLSHSPAPTDDCYSANGAAGAGSSNLSGGSSQRDPAHYAIGWTNDSNNISSLMEAGHRRWMLYPQLGFTSYGQVGGFSAMKVFGFGSPANTPVPAELEFVAFPYMAYPYVLLQDGNSPTPWSLSMVPPAGTSSQFDYFSDASVQVRETATGNTLPVTDLHHDTRGYGLANFLSWLVPDWEYDTPYTVQISNIRMPDNSTRQIQYQVIIDRANLLP